MRNDHEDVYEFAQFRIDGKERTLTRDGAPVVLTEKVFDLLWLLVQNGGRALGKAEIMRVLWPDTVVEENNLTVNISTLRKALGERASERRYIETLARRGYRFVASVRAAPAARQPLPERRESTFVARERELSRLAQLLERAALGQGRLVFVSGEPGMGKTELCEQFLVGVGGAAEPLLLARGRCLEQAGPGEAYLPFLEALGGLLVGPHGAQVRMVLRRHAPSWCSQFPDLLASLDGLAEIRSVARSANAARMLRELGDALAALSAHAPIVLLLEDMHWADESSSDLLRLVAQRVGSWRTLVIATLRGAEIEVQGHALRNIRRELLAHDQCEELALSLFDPSAVWRYLQARFSPCALPCELAARIVSATEGQPLFVTRLVQMLVDRADIVQGSGAGAQTLGHWHLARALGELELGVPAGVRGLIEKKLESLAAEDLRALQHASVVGAEFRVATLASLLGADAVALEERLDQLARVHRLVKLLGEERLPAGRVTSSYRFAHVLYRDVLYQNLASLRRMLVHGQVVEALLAEQGPDIERGAAQIAVHCEAARDAARAIRYLRIAAEQQSRRHAHREAQQYYARGFALLKDLPAEEQAAEEVLLRYDLAWSTNNLDDRATAIRHFEAMVQRASAPDFAGTSPEAERARAAVFAYFAQPWRDAFGVFDLPRMPKQEPSMGAPAILCEAYWGLCHVLSLEGRLDEMGVRAQQYLELAQASHNEPRRVEALAWLATRQLVIGDLDRAEELLGQCIPAARVIDHQRALFVAYNTGRRIAFHVADYQRAERLTTDALALGIEAAGRVDGLLGLGLARAHLGQLSAGLTALNEGVAIAQRAEFEDSLQALHNALGWILLEAGDFAPAGAHFTRARELAQRRGLISGEVHTLSQLSRLELERGQPSAARAALEQARELTTRMAGASQGGQAARDRAWLHFQAAEAEYALAHVDPEAAVRSAASLLAGARSKRAVKHVVIAHELLARAELARGNNERAQRELDQASELLGDHPMPLTAWKVFAARAAERLAARDVAAATAAFGRARELVDEVARGITDDVLRAIWLSSPAVRRLPSSPGAPHAHAARGA